MTELAKASPWRPHVATRSMSTEAGGALVRGDGRWATWTCQRYKAVSPRPGPEVAALDAFTEWRDRHAGEVCER